VVAEETSLRPGTVVELTRDGDAIVLRPVRKRRARYRLEDLVSGITPKNRHDEVSTGERRGLEAW
jgi:antitoxin component of MazEF toxin-antitoxin module